MTIEVADLRSLEQLLRIERECFTTEAYSREQISELLEAPHAICLLAKVDDEAAGFAIGIVETYRTVKVGHVYTIDVAVKHRKKGVGIRLLEEIESEFRKVGAEISYLEVRGDNQAARRLYKKQGYEELETLRDYYSSGVHALRLGKPLGAK